jgi:DNA-directed RNA polymerase beta' subunit
MATDIKEIASINFGIYSPEEILNMSVCKIDNPRKQGYGSVYDPRMGNTDSNKNCETCNENAIVCTGHFGHVELAEPIIHPLYYKRVISFLNCFCFKCFRLILTRDQIYLLKLNRSKGENRFVKIQEKITKVDICCHDDCKSYQPKFRFSVAESNIYMSYNQKNKNKNKTSVIVSTEEIKRVFDNISNDDVKLLGFDPKLTHPKNFIITYLPIIPPCDRPFVKADGNICDDDITIQYIEIIKANNHLIELIEENKESQKDLFETKKQKLISTIRFRILTTFNNSAGKAKHTTNGRPIKGIKERLTGKDGQLRTNLLGKRCIFEDTPVLCWSGKTKKAKDIEIGDAVVGDDGLPRLVIDTCSGMSPLYRIEQNLGIDYEVNSEHLITVRYCCHAKIYWKKDYWVIYWFDKEDFAKKSKRFSVSKIQNKEQALIKAEKFRETLDTNPYIDIPIEKYYKLPKETKRLLFGVKLNTHIKWDKKEVQLDPYILGCWLGDGNSAGSILTNIDQDVISYWRQWAENSGGCLNTRSDGIHHCVVRKTKKGPNPLNEKLRYYNLIKNKHIPEDYIINDKETRLAVLAGLIDTDGSVECNGTTIILTQSPEKINIINGANRIAQSLGFRTNIYEKKTSWTHKGIKKRGTAILLGISGKGVDEIPTLIPRKKCVSPKLKDMSSCKINVVPIGIGRYCGFEVDQNNRFLLGDYTITHNCNQTGRTVIGPDPTLKMGQLAVPELMANTLTVPERVTAFNRHKLQKLVNSGEVHRLIKPDGKTFSLKRYRKGTRLIPGDVIVRGDRRIVVTSSKEPLLAGDELIRNGEKVENVIHCNRDYPIEIGWIVDRKLSDGDIVLLNRQPTLHRASMLAMEVVVRPHKTLRFNLAINKPFNADFDGDEMNIHVAQTLESQAELRMVAAAKYNLISPQSSKSNMAIVQDSCLGSYIMTKGFQKITKDKFFNIAIALNLSSEVILQRVNEINAVLKQKGKRVNAYTGKGLISLFLPKDFIYEKKNNIDLEEPIIKIWKGVLYEGTLDKTVVSSSHNSLIQTMNKEYGPDMATNFIDSVIFLTNNWLLNSTFTVGLGDCLVSQNRTEDGSKTQEKIQDVISKCFLEAETIKTNTTHPGIREMRINAALNKARDIGLKLAKDGLNPNNNYISTVKSGSKGDFFNIAQITGLIGQQNLKGQRIPLLLNHGKRSLQHYPFDNMTPEMEYESRGFVSSSFIKGMNPREFYFHSTTGREGVSDTAMGTATSGYIQRRIIKLTEDMRIQYDGSVRDVTGRLYQMAYDDSGFDPIHTVNVKGVQESCDISRLINKLNMKHEENIGGVVESKQE